MAIRVEYAPEYLARKRVRRDRFGRFNPRGHYYATKAGVLRRLPAYRKRAPKVEARRPQPALPRGAAVEPAAPAPAPVAPPRTTASGRTGAKISTWFKAAGTMETDGRITYSDSYKRGLMDEDYEDPRVGYAVPGMFFSNQGALLGQVKFSGEVPLEDLLALLNERLQFLGEEAPEFDFRKVYAHWEYSYAVKETIGLTTVTLRSKRDRR